MKQKRLTPRQYNSQWKKLSRAYDIASNKAYREWNKEERILQIQVEKQMRAKHKPICDKLYRDYVNARDKLDKEYYNI